MANKMLIDATHPEETRVVVLRGNRVEEFDFESASRRQLRGNIYLAKVTRVEPSLQAAFIDYGGNRHGFLAFSEIHPDYYQIPVADRQALIDEEERAHRAAEVEADRRAAARTSHSMPANRHERGQRVASEPAPERTGGFEGPAGGGPEEPSSEFPADPSQAASAEIGALAAPGWGCSDRDSEAGSSEAHAPVQGGGETPADGAATAEAAGTGAPIGEQAAVGVEIVSETTELAFARPVETSAEGEVAGMPAIARGDDEDDEEDAESGRQENKNGAGTADEDEEHDEDEDDDDDDEDEDEDEDEDGEDDEDETAATEDTVESVGGADALEEAQERAPRVRRQYKIQEVIRRRQIMLVQVVKEERGTKGAALTTYLSLAGRYSVLMPNTARGGGISRKITSPQDRNRLKDIAQDLEVPEGMGVILRTAGAMRTKTEIKRDFEYLLRMWEQVRDLTLKSSAPTLVYEEGSVVKRAIRDLYNKDIDEVIVAGEEAHREAKDFMRMLMPSHAKNVRLYGEGQPLLIRYGVESQLDAMFSPIVQLRSGGYIVLNQAEALVAIDVNSGRATREHHIEDTALKTNLEAAEEIARQLRLRDLAGLIVIDFIDMDEKRNNRAVERRLKECLKNDRARIQVGRISHFGLLEMSRQRIRTSVFESSTEKCPHCGGTGHVRSVASVTLQCLRMLEETLLRGATHNITVRTGTEIALYMLNHKRAHLRELEQRFRITVTVKADATPSGQQPFLIEKGEQVHSLEQARALAAQPSAPIPLALSDDEEIEDEAELETEDVSAGDEFVEDAERAEAGENGGRRRRRRRRRGRRGDERPEGGPFTSETAAEHAVAHEDHNGFEGEEAAVAPPRLPDQPAGEDETGEGGPGDPRRRRRRGRRGGRRNRRSEGEGGQPTSAEDAAEPLERDAEEAGADFGSPSFDFEPSAGEQALRAEREGEAGADELPRIPAGAEQAPLFNEQADAVTPTSRLSAEAASQPAAPHPEEEEAPAGASVPVEPAARAESRPRRRSTVREPVAFPSEGNVPAPPEAARPEAAPPETAPAGAAAVEPAEVESAEVESAEVARAEAGETASEAEQARARRTGWWARRLVGGNKG